MNRVRCHVTQSRSIDGLQRPLLSRAVKAPGSNCTPRARDAMRGVGADTHAASGSRFADAE
jgi:hypothetical protein